MINKDIERANFRQNYRSSHLVMFYVGFIGMLLGTASDIINSWNNGILFYLNLAIFFCDFFMFILAVMKKASIYTSLLVGIYFTIAVTLIEDYILMYTSANFSQLLMRDLFVVFVMMMLCSINVSRVHGTIISAITSIFIVFVTYVSKDPFLLDASPMVVVAILGMGNGFNYFIKILEKSVYEVQISREKTIEKNKELELMNNELELQKKQLMDTQSQLIQAEKMATLGHLISGIAHEINTPLGAIKASINNISVYIKSTLEEKVPEIFRNLSEDELTMFFAMMNKSMENTIVISSREKRAYKKALNEILSKEGIDDSNGIADTLADMGIYEGIEPYLQLLKSKNSKLIIETSYELSGIMRNSTNINIAVEKASKIIFALKNYSHNYQSEEILEGDIIDGIETVLALYHHNIKQGVEIIRNYKDIPKIMCYPDELNQVWTNILSNALQAIEYKGVIEICAYSEEEWVVITISNNGPCIPVEIREKIFEPFFTTKRQGEGTGLGLDIVRKIIKKHKGDIYVESNSEKTTFIIKLPICIFPE